MALEEIYAVKDDALNKMDEAKNKLFELTTKKNNLNKALKEAISDGKYEEIPSLESQIKVCDAQIPALIEAATTVNYKIDMEKASNTWNQHIENYNKVFDKKFQEYTEAKSKLCKLFMELMEMQDRVLTEQHDAQSILGINLSNLNPSVYNSDSHDGLSPLIFYKPHRFSNHKVFYEGGYFNTDLVFFISSGDISKLRICDMNSVISESKYFTF